MKAYPLLFKPNMRNTIWGGSRIMRWKGLPPEEMPVGESWEVSAVPGAQSVISNGPCAGMALDALISQIPVEILGKEVARRYDNQLPLLAKVIDAETDLSIQVHPSNEMAQALHGCKGKSEMWYVIDAQLGSYLYSGFKRPVTPQEYMQRVADGTITHVLARHDVRPGDVFYIPPGRIHAIGGGVLLAEIQQSSDVTYRIYDYGRLGLDGKPRELHTELAVKAIDYSIPEDYRTEYSVSFSKANKCVDSPYFNVRVVDLNKPFHRNLKKYSSFVITLCMRGSCAIKLRNASGAPVQTIELKEGYSCLIPASVADYDIIPTGEGGASRKVQLLDAYIDGRQNGLLHKLGHLFNLQ